MSTVKNVRNQEGENIHVEVFTPEEIKGTVVFCHGITGCRKGRTMDDDYFQKMAQMIQDKNYKAVLFDFSGHGESEGNDYDVTLTKSTDELRRVFEAEVDLGKEIKFVAFSYGATVLCNFLESNPGIIPSGIVLYSPCFYPLESCFLNENSIFGKDIVKAYNNGDLEKNGYAVVGAKNFKFGYNMIDDCRRFKANRFIELRDNILVLAGKQDVILDLSYNEEFCKKNNIRMKYFDASHSLYEDIENAIAVSLEFLRIE